MTEGKQPCFMGTLGMKEPFLNMFLVLFLYFKSEQSTEAFCLHKFNKVFKYWNIFTLGSLLGAFSIVFEKELFMGYQTTALGERNLKNVLEPLGSFAEQEQQKLVPTLSASPARLPFCTCLLPQWGQRIVPTMTWGQGSGMESWYPFKDSSGAVPEMEGRF